MRSWMNKEAHLGPVIRVTFTPRSNTSFPPTRHGDGADLLRPATPLDREELRAGGPGGFMPGSTAQPLWSRQDKTSGAAQCSCRRLPRRSWPRGWRLLLFLDQLVGQLFLVT